MDELDVLKLVAARLESASIRYMVTGSMAMNFYAQPRMTRGIDVVVEMAAGDGDRLVALFAADFLCEAEAVATAVRDRGMFNIIHYDAVVKVDFIVRKDSPYRVAEIARRRAADVDGAVLWMVAAEDLILSKLLWAKDTLSELQLGDVRNLLASVQTLDWGYIERWAPDLSVSELLAEVRR